MMDLKSMMLLGGLQKMASEVSAEMVEDLAKTMAPKDLRYWAERLRDIADMFDESADRKTRKKPRRRTKPQEIPEKAGRVVDADYEVIG